MRTALITSLLLPASLALSACSQSASDGEGSADDGTALPLQVAQGEAVDDVYVTCALTDYDGMAGMTITHNYIVTDGAAKVYVARENKATDMCMPGMDGCSLTAAGGVIVSDYTAAGNGTRTITRVDLATMEVTENVTKPGEAARDISHSGKCEEQPLPAL